MVRLPDEHAGHVCGDEDGEEQQVAAEVPSLLLHLCGLRQADLVDSEGHGEEAVEEPGDDGADDDRDYDSQ